MQGKHLSVKTGVKEMEKSLSIEPFFVIYIHYNDFSYSNCEERTRNYNTVRTFFHPTLLQLIVNPTFLGQCYVETHAHIQLSDNGSNFALFSTLSLSASLSHSLSQPLSLALSLSLSHSLFLSNLCLLWLCSLFAPTTA